MEIVKKGNPADAKIPAKCTGKGNSGRGCGTEVRVDGYDIFEYKTTDYSGDSTYYRTWVCPICHHWNDLPEGVKATGLTNKCKPPSPDGVQTFYD